MTPPDTPAPVSLKQAARITGTSLSTLRRRKPDLLKYGATQRANGTWSIPIDTLAALGLLDHVTPPGGGTTGGVTTPPDTPHVAPPDTPSKMREELAELRVELAHANARADLAEQRAHGAEALAAERNRIIALLEAGPTTPDTAHAEHAPQPASPTGEAEPDTKPAGFWSRWTRRRRTDQA